MFDPRLDSVVSPQGERLRGLLAAMPASLRRLLEDELARGNRVERIESGFPAPPVGACVVLALSLDEDAAAQQGGSLHWREWPNASRYRGCTDADARIFLLGPLPPRPPTAGPPDPRAGAAASPVAAPNPPMSAPTARPVAEPGASDDALQAFKASMQLDYERWREGSGYDLDALDRLAPEELREVAHLLSGRGVRGWRDVEALARLDGDVARSALRDALVAGSHEVRMAVLRLCPDLGTPASRLDALLRAIAGAAPFDGLSATLDIVEAFHPPAVIDALWRGLREREGGVAVHFAAMLAFLHGRAPCRFDMAQRSFFLRFSTSDGCAREAAIDALRRRLE